MTIPRDIPPIPDIVTAIAGGRPVAAVWVNELGGVTFRVGSDPGEFVKVGPAAELLAEAARLRWAAPYVRVPQVLAAGAGWLHTAGLPGRCAVDPHWVADPRSAVRAIGSGLRMLHESLPIADCPFDWSAPSRLARLTEPVQASLRDPPPVDRLVVCHGDACAPNTLIGDDGTCAGHVDLGDLGVADRWADLAVATLSLSWNYAGSWADELFDAYGVVPDVTRIDYYRRLWNAGDLTSH